MQAQILNLLRAAAARPRACRYLFITHNIGVVEYLADEVVVLRNGKVEEQGPVARVLVAPESAYTRKLLDAIPRLITA